jgi:hypothetical protein
MGVHHAANRISSLGALAAERSGKRCRRPGPHLNATVTACARDCHAG